MRDAWSASGMGVPGVRLDVGLSLLSSFGFREVASNMPAAPFIAQSATMPRHSHLHHHASSLWLLRKLAPRVWLPVFEQSWRLEEQTTLK